MSTRDPEPLHARDPLYDRTQDEKAQAQHMPQMPRPGSLEDARDRGYDPSADEGTY